MSQGLKISDLIRELVEVIAQRGDLQVFFYDGACKHPLEVLVFLHRTGNTVGITRKYSEQELAEGRKRLLQDHPEYADLLREWEPTVGTRTTPPDPQTSSIQKQKTLEKRWPKI